MRIGEKCWRSELDSAANSEWILLRAFAQSIMCLISREGTHSLLLDQPFLSALANASATVRLGAAPVCQSLYKQKPNFPLWTNQHLFSISPRLWSAPSPVTFQKVALILPCSLSVFKVFSLFTFSVVFGLNQRHHWKCVPDIVDVYSRINDSCCH